MGTRAIPDLKNATWVEKAWHNLISGSERPDFVDWLGTSNLFVRREEFLGLGGFSESLIAGKDVDLGFRIAKNYMEEKMIL